MTGEETAARSQEGSSGTLAAMTLVWSYLNKTLCKTGDDFK